MTTRIFVGDCREVLAGLPDNWYHTCVTSPPYWGLRDYGTEGQVWGGVDGCDHEWGEDVPGSNRGGSGTPTDKNNRGEGYGRDSARGQFCHLCNAWRGNLGLEPTPALYVEHMVEVFREVRRVLRDDGVCWLNLGDSYATGGGKVGRCPGGGEQGERFGKRWAGVDNLTQPNRLPIPGLKPKDLVGIPWRVAFALQADGWWLRSDIIWNKPNCMPESVTDRPTKSHEYVFLLTKSARYFYDADAVREKQSATSGGFQARGKRGNTSHGDGEQTSKAHAPVGTYNGYRNIRTVWTIPTRSFRGAHFATFPPALVTPCIKAGSSERGCCPECGSPWSRVSKVTKSWREDACHNEQAYGPGSGNRTARSQSGGMSRNESTTTGWTPTCACYCGPAYPEPVPSRCLDPFGGAGTVALVSRQLGRDCDLVELNSEYATMAQQRLDQTPVLTVETDAGAVEVQQMPMFSEVTVQ